jgi:hypothetical protein
MNFPLSGRNPLCLSTSCKQTLFFSKGIKQEETKEELGSDFEAQTFRGG